MLCYEKYAGYQSERLILVYFFFRTCLDAQACIVTRTSVTMVFILFLFFFISNIFIQGVPFSWDCSTMGPCLNKPVFAFRSWVHETDFNYLCHFSVKKWQKEMQIKFCISPTLSACKWLKSCICTNIIHECNSVSFFSCDQAALWMVFSVCLSNLFHYVPIIVSSWNFQELLPMTNVRSMQKVKVRRQRSRSQRSKPNLTVTPVWIHIWLSNDAQSLMLIRRGALLYFKVIRQISRSHG